jgi:hypothetical protein
MRPHMRHRIIAPTLAAMLLSATGLLLVSAGSGAEPSKSQTLFRKLLLEDAKTTTAIKTLLDKGGGMIAPEIEFVDLTGDERSDAVVSVDSGGAAGAIGIYVFSTHGRPKDSDLRAVYRSQRLYRANPQVSDGRLLVQTPRFARGDDLCCPAKVVERTYSWSADANTLVKRATREFDGPR